MSWSQTSCAACGAAINPAVGFWHAQEQALGVSFPADVLDAHICVSCWGSGHGMFPTDPADLIVKIRARLAGQQGEQEGQEIWVPSEYVPEPERAGTPCTLIRIPTACPACGATIVLRRLGDHELPGLLNRAACEHVGSWQDLVAVRIQAIPPAPAGPPACTHCGEFNPFQSGPFLCWQCTQDPWR